MSCAERLITSDYRYQKNCHELFGTNVREVFEYLVFRVGAKDKIRISNLQIAADLKVSASTIKRRISILCEIGAIVRHCVRDGYGHSIRTLELVHDKIDQLLYKRETHKLSMVDHVKNKVNRVNKMQKKAVPSSNVTRINPDYNADHCLTRSLMTSSNSHLLREEKTLHLVSFLEAFNSRAKEESFTGCKVPFDNKETEARYKKFKHLISRLKNWEGVRLYLDKIFSLPFTRGEVPNKTPFTIDQLLQVEIYDKMMSNKYDDKTWGIMQRRGTLSILAYVWKYIDYNDLSPEIIAKAEENNINIGHLRYVTESDMKQIFGLGDKVSMEMLRDGAREWTKKTS